MIPGEQPEVEQPTAPVQVRKSYLDTSRGQIHYRAAGEGPGIVLLHWGPGHGEQYAHMLPVLADQGYHALVPDLPGFGMSLRRQDHWSIADFATNLNECLDTWDLASCSLVGGHLASLIAMEAALQQPARIQLLVLDGTPTWDQQTREKVIATATRDQPLPDADGTHLTALWQHLLWEVGMWRPNLAFGPELSEFAMGLLKAKILADFDMRPGRALAEYDACAALARLDVPVLALTADDDPLNNCHTEVLKLVKHAKGHCFTGDHPIHDATRADEYLSPILASLREQP